MLLLLREKFEMQMTNGLIFQMLLHIDQEDEIKTRALPRRSYTAHRPAGRAVVQIHHLYRAPGLGLKYLCGPGLIDGYPMGPRS